MPVQKNTSKSKALTTKHDKKRIFRSQKGKIVSNRKFSRQDHQKKAVFIAFTALLPHSNILPPQKIDPLFVKILLSHKGRSDKENVLIRYLTSLAHAEHCDQTSNDKANLEKMYENISTIAREFVDQEQDYSKASIAVDTTILLCKLTEKEYPAKFTFYSEKAALFFLDKEANIMEYVKSRKMVHPSIMKRSLEYAKLALLIASHYAFQSDNKGLIKQIENRQKDLLNLEKKFQSENNQD